MAKAQVRILPSARNTVMVVDDQSTGRAILEQVVRSLDGRVGVEGFARPVDAVVWATRHVADLVLVDYMMPDMDGIEFVKRLRALPGYEHVPIVMVTVHDDRKVRYAALDAGITDFLTKPVDARECLARCRNLLTLRRRKPVGACSSTWSRTQRAKSASARRKRCCGSRAPASSATRRRDIT